MRNEDDVGGHVKLQRHTCSSDYYLRRGAYVIVVCLFVCLTVSNFAQKLPNGFA